MHKFKNKWLWQALLALLLLASFQAAHAEGSLVARLSTTSQDITTGDVIPLALQVITHPSGTRPGIESAQPGLRAAHQALVARLECLEQRRELRPGSSPRAAQLLMSLAHDWALVHAAHLHGQLLAEVNGNASHRGKKHAQYAGQGQ
jgi:hypothetical protein